MEIRDQIISEVIRYLGEDAKRSGSVLYNGWNTLCPNRGQRWLRLFGQCKPFLKWRLADG